MGGSRFYLFASSVRHPFVMYGTLHCKKTARHAGHEILKSAKSDERFCSRDRSRAALCRDTEGGSPNKRR
jgi:hypothetical protein